MDHANQRLETGYEPIHVDVWRPDLWLKDEAIYTKKFTDPLADVFLPMKASALHAGMTYLTPLVFQNASSKLPDYQRQLIERLKM